MERFVRPLSAVSGAVKAMLSCATLAIFLTLHSLPLQYPNEYLDPSKLAGFLDQVCVTPLGVGGPRLPAPVFQSYM